MTDLSHRKGEPEYRTIFKGGQGRTRSDVERYGSVLLWVAFGVVFSAGLVIGLVLA